MGLSRFAEDLAPLCTLLAGVLGAAPGSGAEEASWAGPAPGCPGPRHTARQAPALRFSPAQHFQRCYEFPRAAWLGVKPAASASLVAASSRCGRCLKGAVACPGRDAARVLLQPAPAPHSQSRDGSGAKPTSSALELVAPPVLLLLGKSAALHRCGEASPGSLVLGCPKSGVLPRSGMAEHRVPVLGPTVPCPRGCRCPAPGAGAAACLSLSLSCEHPIPLWDGTWAPGDRVVPHLLRWQGWRRWLWVVGGHCGLGRGEAPRCFARASPAARGCFQPLHQVPEPSAHGCSAEPWCGGKRGRQPSWVQPWVLPQPHGPREAGLQGCPLPGDGITPETSVVTLSSPLPQPGPSRARRTLLATGSALGPQQEQSCLCISPSRGWECWWGLGCQTPSGSIPGGLPGCSAGDAPWLGVAVTSIQGPGPGTAWGPGIISSNSAVPGHQPGTGPGTDGILPGDV